MILCFRKLFYMKMTESGIFLFFFSLFYLIDFFFFFFYNNAAPHP